MVWIAELRSRSPPRLRRWRDVWPDDASIDDTRERGERCLGTETARVRLCHDHSRS